MIDRVFRAEDVKLTSFSGKILVNIQNPIFVINSRSQRIGVANVSVVNSGFDFTMDLDSECPERLDLEVNPNDWCVRLVSHSYVWEDSGPKISLLVERKNRTREDRRRDEENE